MAAAARLAKRRGSLEDYEAAEDQQWVAKLTRSDSLNRSLSPRSMARLQSGMSPATSLDSQPIGEEAHEADAEAGAGRGKSFAQPQAAQVATGPRPGLAHPPSGSPPPAAGTRLPTASPAGSSPGSEPRPAKEKLSLRPSPQQEAAAAVAAAASASVSAGPAGGAARAASSSAAALQQLPDQEFTKRIQMGDTFSGRKKTAKVSEDLFHDPAEQRAAAAGEKALPALAEEPQFALANQGPTADQRFAQRIQEADTMKQFRKAPKVSASMFEPEALDETAEDEEDEVAPAAPQAQPKQQQQQQQHQQQQGRRTQLEPLVEEPVSFVGAVQKPRDDWVGKIKSRDTIQQLKRAKGLGASTFVDPEQTRSSSPELRPGGLSELAEADEEEDAEVAEPRQLMRGTRERGSADDVGSSSHRRNAVPVPRLREAVEAPDSHSDAVAPARHSRASSERPAVVAAPQPHRAHYSVHRQSGSAGAVSEQQQQQQPRADGEPVHSPRVLLASLFKAAVDLHKRGSLNEEQKGAFKDRIIRQDAQLLNAAQRFASDGDEGAFHTRIVSSVVGSPQPQPQPRQQPAQRSNGSAAHSATATPAAQAPRTASSSAAAVPDPIEEVEERDQAFDAAVEALFERLDADSDGRLAQSDVLRALRAAGVQLSDEDFARVMAEIKREDPQGSLRFADFLELYRAIGAATPVSQ